MNQEITLYTREGCHLCEEAKRAIEAIRREGVAFDLREVDVDSDPSLRERFGNDVPVLFSGGRELMRHRVDETRFRAVLAGESAEPELSAMACVPCRGGVPPMDRAQVADYLRRLGGSWRSVDDHHLENEYRFPDFARALAFTNRIGELAEREGHHPDIELAWGRVGVKIWTHKIDGLTESDFVLAAKIDQL